VSVIESPSRDALANVRWQQVIADAKSPECWEYCNAFCRSAAEAETEGDDRARNVYAFFARVTCLSFKLDEQSAPLGSEDRLLSFTDAELALLADLVTSVADPEMRARVADVLWLRNYGEAGKRDYRYAQRAVEAYLASARRVESPAAWTACVDRTERALQVASMLGKRENNRQYNDVIAYIEEMLDRYHGDDPLYLSARLMELLQAERRGDSGKYSFLADKAARRAEAEHDWWRAREYWERKARWHEMEGDDSARKVALIAAAETYVGNANDRLAGDHPDYLVASTFYVDAITTFRRIGGMQERCEQLQRELLVLQEKSVPTMGRFSASVEIPNAEELVEQARSQVRDKPLLDALTSLALVSTSPSVASLQRSIEEVRTASPLFTIFPRVLVNERGRTQKRMLDAVPDPDNARLALEAHMFESAVNARRRKVLTAIWPALDQVNRDHNIRVRDLAPLVIDNLFVPVGRESIFARGLYAGLTGDFLVASHLLIPQLEHAVRVLLESRGVIVSGIEDDGSQPERGLNTTLIRPEALDFFGEDLAFDLRGLLVEKSGSNLRHTIAHGLLDGGAFQTTEAIYVWWITLRICVLAASAIATQVAAHSLEGAGE
jgi:hypothetical protein